MRLFVLGASGRTGSHFLDLALARGHDLTAFVRSPGKLTRSHARLRLAQGDPHSTDQLSAALPGHDAVISTLGVYPRDLLRPISLVADCMASTVAAMTRTGVTRLSLVSAATLFPGGGLMFSVVRALLRHQIRDLVSAETILRATPLEWTIARPPRLVQSAAEGYVSAVDELPRGETTMSFRAVAAFLLDAAEAHAHVREVVGLAGPRGAA